MRGIIDSIGWHWLFAEFQMTKGFCGHIRAFIDRFVTFALSTIPMVSSSILQMTKRFGVHVGSSIDGWTNRWMNRSILRISTESFDEFECIRIDVGTFIDSALDMVLCRRVVSFEMCKCTRITIENVTALIDFGCHWLSLLRYMPIDVSKCLWIDVRTFVDVRSIIEGTRCCCCLSFDPFECLRTDDRSSVYRRFSWLRSRTWPFLDVTKRIRIDDRRRVHPRLSITTNWWTDLFQVSKRFGIDDRCTINATIDIPSRCNLVSLDVFECIGMDDRSRIDDGFIGRSERLRQTSSL